MMDPRQTYINNLKDFLDHLNNEYNALMGDCGTRETCQEFYDSEFIITFRGKTVNLGNNIETFQGIEELINLEISELEEI